MAAILVSVHAFALSTFTALAEEGSGLEPRFGDGKLVVGNGLEPGEQVTFGAKAECDQRQPLQTWIPRVTFRHHLKAHNRRTRPHPRSVTPTMSRIGILTREPRVAKLPAR